jgi:MFS family permease
MTSIRAVASDEEADTAQGVWGTLIAGCLAVCIAQLALSMPATLNGLFQADFHTTGSQLTWVTDAFFLPAAALELSFGVLGDLFGRKRLVLIGTGILAVGALVSATASAVAQLWVGNALAGVGAAALLPCSLAAIVHATPGKRWRARAVTAWAACLSVGGILAALLGGLVGNYATWPVAFYVLLGLAVLTGLVTLLAAGESSAPEGRSLDWGGQVTAAVGLFALLFGVIQGQADGFGSVQAVIGFVVAAVCLAAFVVAETKARSPMLRLDLFRNRAFAAASAVAVVGMISYLGTAYELSVRMGVIQDQNPLRVAAAFAFLSGVTPVMGPLTTRLLLRFDARALVAAGLLFMAGGDLWLATLPIGDTSLPTLFAPLVCFGIGFALVISAMTTAAVNGVPLHLAGMASAATGLFRDVGMTPGPAIIGTVALGQASTRFYDLLGHSGISAAGQQTLTGIAHSGGTLAVLGGVQPNSALAGGIPLAVSALGHGFSVGFVACAAAALVSFLIVLAFRGPAREADSVSTSELPTMRSQQ